MDDRELKIVERIEERIFLRLIVQRIKGVSRSMLRLTDIEQLDIV